MCQYCWTRVPRHFAKHYFWYFLGGVFGMRLTFKSVGLSKYPWQCGWVSSNKLKAVIKQRLISSEQEGILPANCFGLFPGSQDCWPNLKILDIHLHNHVRQFLKLNQSLSLSPSLLTHAHTHKHPFGSFSREPWLIQKLKKTGNWVQV